MCLRLSFNFLWMSEKCMRSQIRDFFQARKRKVSIHVAQGDNVRAISELNRYLKEFMNDGEAWMELCDLYILEQVGSNSHGLINRTRTCY